MGRNQPGTRPLTKTQRDMLAIVVDLGGHFPGAGWYWHSGSEDRRLLLALERKGMVFHDHACQAQPCYRATVVGVETIKKGRG